MKNTLAALTILSTGCYSFLQDPIEGESAGTTQGTSSSSSTSSTSTALSTSGSTSGAEGGNSGTSSTSSSSSTGHEDDNATTISLSSTSDKTTGESAQGCPEMAPDMAELEGEPCPIEDISIGIGDVIQNGEKCDKDCTVPKCGDSVFNPLAGEVCDDGAALNDKEGSFCKQQCKERGIIAFVTSKGDFTGKIEKEGYEPGVLAADAYCAEAASSIPELAATTNGLVLSWLSAKKDGPDISPKERFNPCTESYFLPRSDTGNERIIIAKDFTDLTTTSKSPPFTALINHISRTEFGDFIGNHEPSITGTNGDGTRNILGDCDGYTSEEGAATYGNPYSIYSYWSNIITLPCKTPAHLYCFEQCPP